MTTGLRQSSMRRSRSCRSGGGRLVAPGGVLERRDVGAGDERPPGAADHDRGDAGVALGRVERGGQALGHARAERVDRRVVDLDDEHVAVTMGANELGHGQRIPRARGARSVQREADVVLREAGHRRAGVDEIVEIGELAAAIEGGGPVRDGAAARSSSTRTAARATSGAGRRPSSASSAASLPVR